MISPNYLIYHDLIGIDTYAKLKSENKNKEFKHLGIVIDETQNMIITELNNKVKKYIKKDYNFRFTVDGGFLLVDGIHIVGNPINRLRSLKKKKRLRI